MAACALARAKLAQYVAKLKTSSFAEKTGTAIKAGYLASPKTNIRNIVGNASMGGVEYLGVRPLSVALDYIGSVAKSAATMGEIKPHEFRQIANTLNWKGLQQGAKGWREGLAKSVQLLRTGVDAEHALNKFDVSETTFGNTALDKTVHAVFNVMEAADKPFFGFTFQTDLYGRASLTAIREGLTGAAKTARIDQLLANPTEEMLVGALNTAQYATFKNATALSDAASSLRTGIKRRMDTAPPGRKLGYGALSVGLDVTIPFTKVASAIANAGIDYSPAGFAKALINAADKDPLVQAQIAQRLSRATIGTGLTLLGYSMYGNGTITGSYPTNAAERARWDLEGKQANSILLGGRWRSITFLGPLAIPLLVGANLKRFTASEDNKGLSSSTAFAVGSLGKTMTEQSYLQGLSNVIAAMNDPATRGAGAIAGMVPIPALVGQFATALDPVQRQASTVGGKVASRLPFLSTQLPPRLNSFGDALQKTPGGLQGAAETLLDITNPKTYTESDVTREMDRLDINPGRIGASLKMGTEKVRRTPQEVNALTSEFGAVKRARLKEIIADPGYRQLPDEEKKRVLEKALRDVGQSASEIDRARRISH